MEFITRQYSVTLVTFMIVAMFVTSCTGTKIDTVQRRHWEDISVILDTKKESIYSTYNKYLRQYPDLNGKVVFELMIGPSGRVTKIRTISSEIDNSEFLQELMDKIVTYKFGAKNVDTIALTFPIQFPAKWQMR